MALPSDYIAGTITLTNGSTAFTGTGTGWLAADFREGDIILDVEGGEGAVAVIQSITSNTTGVLAKEWEGATLTDVAYRIRYQWDSGRVAAQSRAAVEMLGNGNLQSFAAVTGPGVVVMDGPHSVAIKPETDFINGVAYDVQVDTLTDRDAYDGQSEGFAVLVSDIGDGRSALYSKNSNTVGDWSDPAYITGPRGDAPEVEATVDMLPPGSTATVTPTPITGGVRLDFELPEASGFYNAGVYDIGEAYNQDDVVRHNGSSFIALQAVPAGTSPSSASPPVDTAYWQVLAAKGQDGTGTGDVVGPAGAVDGRIAVFDGASGKLLKDGGVTIQANIIDTSPDRLLRQGAFGLGAGGTYYADLASVPRLNGYYLVLAGAANGMPTNGYWSVSYLGESSGHGFFIAAQTLTNAGVWWGLNTNSGFQGWQRLRSSSDAGWETIAVTNPTSALNVEFKDLGAFRTLRLTCGLLPSGVTPIGIQVSNNNGSTWLTSSSYTHYGYYMVAGVVQGQAGAAVSYIELASAATGNIIDTSQTILTEFNKTVRTNTRVTKSGLNNTDRIVSDWGVEIDGNTAWNALRVTATQNLSGQIILEGVRG